MTPLKRRGGHRRANQRNKGGSPSGRDVITAMRSCGVLVDHTRPNGPTLIPRLGSDGRATYLCRGGGRTPARPLDARAQSRGSALLVLTSPRNAALSPSRAGAFRGSRSRRWRPAPGRTPAYNVTLSITLAAIRAATDPTTTMTTCSPVAIITCKIRSLIAIKDHSQETST